MMLSLSLWQQRRFLEAACLTACYYYRGATVLTRHFICQICKVENSSVDPVSFSSANSPPIFDFLMENECLISF